MGYYPCEDCESTNCLCGRYPPRNVQTPWLKDWPPYFNGSSTPCDLAIGDCACGANHSLGEFHVQGSVLFRETQLIGALLNFLDKESDLRASGLATCEYCQNLYWRHPICPNATYLNVLCDGSLVKL